jgi:hypothetical protein
MPLGNREPPGGTLNLALALLLTVTAVSCPAQENENSGREWFVEVGVGAEYDTNVSVDEVDLSSGQSDYAWVADFNLGLKQQLGDKSRLGINYDVSQSSYSKFSEVDRLTQILGADISREIGPTSAGLSAYYIDSRLDGDGFLRYVRLSPSLSGFISKRWFARGAYVYSERRIEDRESRDADTQSAEGDLYYFHRGLRSYLNLGYRYRSEDAVAPEFDFGAHSIKLRYIRRIEALGTRWKAELALRYEARDYVFEEPTIEEKRNDDRLQLKFDLEAPLSPRFTWQFYYSYGDYESNLPRADFVQTIVGTRLQFRW